MISKTFRLFIGSHFENLKEFTSVDEVIESLKKNQTWKLSVIQEEIAKF